MKKMILSLAAVSALASVARPAAAQPWDNRYNDGRYDDRYDGRNYRVEATSPRGPRVRLVVDAREGDVIGREPLDGVYYPSDRVRPAAPGYGWTEDDMRPRRPIRRSGDDPPAVRTETHAIQIRGMPLQLQQALPGGGVPHSRRPIR